ncbi:MAG: hypothetical protein IEMM0008_0497 [bacterium]|nr:MAG: hypothetical protein IEMM0008_0497 [bacterium]
MQDYFGLLLLVSFVGLVLSLIKPNIFEKLKITSRKKSLMVFVPSIFVSLLAIGITAPPLETENTSIDKPVSEEIGNNEKKQLETNSKKSNAEMKRTKEAKIKQGIAKQKQEKLAKIKLEKEQAKAEKDGDKLTILKKSIIDFEQSIYSAEKITIEPAKNKYTLFVNNVANGTAKSSDVIQAAREVIRQARKLKKILLKLKSSSNLPKKNRRLLSQAKSKIAKGYDYQILAMTQSINFFSTFNTSYSKKYLQYIDKSNEYINAGVAKLAVVKMKYGIPLVTENK